MGKKELVKKKVFLYENNIEEIQEYLSEMAFDGLQFKYKKGKNYYFTRTNSEMKKFRLLPNKNDLTAEEITRYKNDGWDYIGTIGKTAVFCAKQGAHEIKVQSKKNRKMIGLLNNEIMMQRLLLIGVIILFTTLTVGMLFYKGEFWSNIINRWDMNFMLPAVYAFIIFICYKVTASSKCLLRKFEDMPIIDKGDISKTSKKNKKSFILGCAFGALTFMFVINTVTLGLISYNGRDINKFRDRPISALHVINGEKEYISEIEYEKKAMAENANNVIVYGGKYSFTSSLLCRKYYKWNEMLDNKMENSTKSSISGEYYETLNSSIASGVLGELVAKEEKNDGHMIRKKYDGFSEIYVRKYGENCFTILARNKNKIYDISYIGNKKINDVLGNIGKQ